MELLIDMEEMRTEKIEALQVLSNFNEKLLQNIPILIKELQGEKLEDTDKFQKSIIDAINWEVEVVNCTLDILNADEENINKELFNSSIMELSEALKLGEDNRIAQAFQNLIPVFENLGKTVEKVIK